MSHTKKRIVLIEDEIGLQLTLTDRLNALGYEVFAFSSVEDYHAQEEMAVDLFVLDIMLGGQNGLDFCRDLRQQGIQTPVLMLTARREILDRVLGLKLGADDYLTKPFDMLELEARIEALFRRTPATTPGSSEDLFHFGDIEINRKKGLVTKKGQEVPLTALDFELLCYFIDHPDRILPREELLDRVWGVDANIYTRTVDVHLLKLRQKLEPNPEMPIFFHTIHGRGYRFSPQGRF
jgi:two-component system alkaline phosphatase synthesis response regulator PhoP